MPIVLTPENIEEILQRRGVPAEVTDALKKALTWANTANPKNVFPASAAGYIREMDRAGKFGEQSSVGYLEAVKMNIDYALSNMNAWRGEEAREAKKILARYSRS